jgi:transcription elongation factor Elf1
MRKILARLFGLVERQPQAEEQQQTKEDLPEWNPLIECPKCGAISGAKTHFGCMLNVDWIATCESCGHRWGPGMEKYSNLLPPVDPLGDNSD